MAASNRQKLVCKPRVRAAGLPDPGVQRQQRGFGNAAKDDAVARRGHRSIFSSVRRLRVVVDDLYRGLPIVLPIVLSSVPPLGTCQ